VQPAPGRCTGLGASDLDDELQTAKASTVTRVRLVEELVDRLPAKLWRPANLYILPGGDWHFCRGGHRRLSWSVRTIEWRGRQVAYGRREVLDRPAGVEEYDMGPFVQLFRGWGYYRGHPDC
jgi:hypothetical protein